MKTHEKKPVSPVFVLVLLALSFGIGYVSSAYFSVESVSVAEGQCADITNDAVCINVSTCFWNSTDCLDVCIQFDETTCPTIQGCIWDGMKSACINQMPACVTVNDSGTCLAIPGCLWNVSNEPPCFPAGGPPVTPFTPPFTPMGTPPETPFTPLPGGCHLPHPDPATLPWAPINSVLYNISIKDIGCTQPGCAEAGLNATEILVEILNEPYCGAMAWLWLDDGMSPEEPLIDHCYTAEIFKGMYDESCGLVVRYLMQNVTPCPPCNFSNTTTSTTVPPATTSTTTVHQGECIDIPFQQTCDDTPGCHWDYGLDECAPDYMPGFDCHQFNNSNDCLSYEAEGCWWEEEGYEGPECFYLDPNMPQCFKFDLNETACNDTEGCEWFFEDPEWLCEPEGRTYCSGFNDNESACIADPMCIWMLDGPKSPIKPSKSQILQTGFCGVNMGDECHADCSKCWDPGMCGGSPRGCYWNFSQGMCFQGNVSVNPCEEDEIRANQEACDNTFGCKWDSGEGECVRDDNINVSGCPSFPTNSTCSGDPNCVWIYDNRDFTYKCVSKAGEFCNDYTTDWACNQDPSCDWDYAYAECNPSWGGGVCENIFDRDTCKNTGGCKWDDYMWECIEGSVVNCSAQNTTAMCTMYGECSWNGTACRLSDCAKNCSACNVSDSCMKSPQECWWDFGMGKCNPHTEPTCENGACDMCETPEDCTNTTLHPMNNLCGWFEDPTQAPGYKPSPYQSSLLSGGFSGISEEPSTTEQPKCRMNTSCEQDCFMCGSEAECMASTDSAFKNITGACGWDPQSWNPCFPQALDCSTIDNQPQCDPNPDCNWNFDTQECENVNWNPGGGPCDTNCTFCGDEWGCYGSPMGCAWNPQNSPPCSQSNCFSLGCPNCGNMDECMRADGKYRNEGAAGCTWWMYENGSGECMERSCQTDCTLCITDTGCGNSPVGCEWFTDVESQPSGKLKEVSIQQGGHCQFRPGASGACNVDCRSCTRDGDCWGSYAGCRWDYGGQTVHFVHINGSGFSPSELTIFVNDEIHFKNIDSVNHTATSVDTGGVPPDFFDLFLEPGEGYVRNFFNVRNFTVYCSLHGSSGNLSIRVINRNQSTSLCYPNDCKQDCAACNDPGSCDKSYAGCFWDMAYGNCVGKGWGMTCDDDCWNCDNELKCNASNATSWMPSGQVQGCQWVFDYMDGRNGCRPAGMGFNCDAMCEQCNESQCANATPTMLPSEASGCKWFAYEMTPAGNQGACHPNGYSGMGSGCPEWDYTSKSECESHSGCKWFDVDQICDPDFSQMTCNERCDLCNETGCNEKAPKCVWDTPPFGEPFCREDMWTSGGNCQMNCYDCFDNNSCSESGADCRWVKDVMSPMGYHCDPADMPICEEDCFQCFSPEDCLASNNSLKAFKSTDYCVWVDEPNFRYCKPNITMEICFAPGDEDSDGVEGCKDPDCAWDPSCGEGMDKDCWIWDQMSGGNQDICECGENGTLVDGSCQDQVGSEINGTGCVWHLVDKPPYFNETEGLCDPKFADEVFKGMGEDMPIFILHDPCLSYEPPWVSMEKDALENKSWLDICDIGIRDMPNTTAFVLNVRDIDDLGLCNFLHPDSLNESGKYYFMLDIDDNVSSGCTIQVNITEYDRVPPNFMFGESGFEYRLDYEAGFTNGTPTEVRNVYQCVNNTWSIVQATVSGKKDKACEYESIYFGILKSDIGNPSSTMHIVAFTAEASGGFGSPLVAIDRAYHAYYTPNTIDFIPPDCQKDPQACGSGYDTITGVMTFENCFPGTGDEDKDGKANCADEDCITTIFCAQNSSYNASEDRTAPSITSYKAETEQRFALIKWTTSEPATGVVQFYGLNNTCERGVQNISQYDDVFFPMDDYTPTHVVPLDENNPDAAYKLNYSLQPNTTYYFKLRSCDQAQIFNNVTNTSNPNCAVSKCLNFTTKPPCEDILNQTVCKKQGICKWYENSTPKCRKEIEFGFEWQSPSEDPTDPLGGVNFEMTIGNTTTNVSAGTKTRTNESGCNVMLRFKNEMTMLVGGKAPWTIEMQRCCIPKQTMNLTNALQIANASNSSLYLGMNSGVWQQIAQIMGCKSVYMYLPGFHQDCNNISITHCDNSGQNCSLVSMDNATRRFCNSSVSIWELAGSDPTLFSTYTNEYGIDAYAPRVLSGPTVASTTASGAVISWITNENSNSSVQYRECDMEYYLSDGLCARFPENLTVQGSWAHNSTMALSHLVYLTGLSNETMYYYRVISTDASQNQRILDNQEVYYTFSTTGGALEESYSVITGWNLISLPLS